MRNSKRVAVVIPAQNEADAIGKVVGDIPAWVDQIVVADNGSIDATATVAKAAGATVISEPEPGYGAACLAGIAAVEAADIIVFLDGDYSDYPEEMAHLVDPIATDAADIVIGSRVTGVREAGSLMPQQRFGNWLATTLIRLIWGGRYTDLGPFRAIERSKLDALGMADRNFGWTVEMQIRALEEGLRVAEVPVSYRCRIGTSKVSGTIRGTVLAGAKILYIIARQALRRSDAANPTSTGRERGVAL
ncbi:MAG: glycosyltransferase involved in cell wall biosynthesis [Hyphomicrobiaceae bacterium]|jgi:glycosyltransferase involved in cell wall biosynthesis